MSEHQLTSHQQILLAEYRQAQQSAEHHDSLLWTVAGLILTGMAALFGFALTTLNAEGIQRQAPSSKLLLIIPVAALGIILDGCLAFFVWSFAQYRKQKYLRCHKIEEELGMSAHIGTPDVAWRIMLTSRHEVRIKQRWVVYALTVLFGAAWVIWGVTALCLRS